MLSEEEEGLVPPGNCTAESGSEETEEEEEDKLKKLEQWLRNVRRELKQSNAEKEGAECERNSLRKKVESLVSENEKLQRQLRSRPKVPFEIEEEKAVTEKNFEQLRRNESAGPGGIFTPDEEEDVRNYSGKPLHLIICLDLKEGVSMMSLPEKNDLSPDKFSEDDTMTIRGLKTDLAECKVRLEETEEILEQ